MSAWWARTAVTALAVALAAVLAAPSEALARPSVRGGTPIAHRGADVTHVCTGGFTAKRNGHSFLITAGHCGKVGWRWRKHATGRRVGRETQRRVRLRRGLDWAVIRSNGSHRMPPTVRDAGGIRAVARVGRPRVGMRVCLRRGWSGNTRCGRITRVGNRTVRADIGARRGDSGSPLYHRLANGRVSAIGILSSRRNGHTRYQRIRVPLRQADLRLKTR